MIIKQKFTEPEIEVKWYCDSIEEIVIVYVRIQKRAQKHSCMRLVHSTSILTPVSLSLPSSISDQSTDDTEVGVPAAGEFSPGPQGWEDDRCEATDW